MGESNMTYFIADNMNEKCCDDAARRGDVELVKQWRKDGYLWDSKTYSAAARGGHWRFSNGQGRMDVLGIGELVRRLPVVVIW